MGLLRKASRAMGATDKGLIKRGLLARGLVSHCRRTSMSVGPQAQQVVCELTVEVELDDRPVYTATCKHAIPREYLPQFESGEGAVAVRVDPEDPQNIELDLQHAVPDPRPGSVTGPKTEMTSTTTVINVADPSQLPPDVAQQLAASGVDLGTGEVYDPSQNRTSAVSADQIRATGVPCRVVVQSAQPLGFQKDGLDVWGLILTVMVEGEAPSQVRIGTGVPADAVALLFPGANLPAKHRADVPDGTAPDWAAAVAEHH